MKQSKIYTYLLLSIGIVVLLNILSSRYFLRADFTADKRYTLSPATKDIVRSLNDPVTVTAYFTKDLPPAIVQTRSEFKEMLIEYSNLSKGNLVYEFVSPKDDPKIEKELAQKGISPRMITIREKDEAVQKKVYLAAVVSYGDKEEVLPLILPGAAMEYDLSTAIKKLVVEDKPQIGFIGGHGEPRSSSFMQALKSLNVLYDVDDVLLSDTVNLEQYETLALIAPKDSIPEHQFQLLDHYLDRGGNLYVAINRVDGDLSTARGTSVSTGLESWLKEKGVEVDDKFLIDASCGKVSVVQQQGFMKFQTQVAFPYLPIFTNFSDHSVSKGLESVILQFASPVKFIGDTSVKAMPLIYSSDQSGTLTTPLYFDVQKKWNKRDYTQSKLTAALALEGCLSQAPSNRMVVIGDGDFAVNGNGQEARQVNPDNVNLMVNAVDWLSDDTGLIELRTKGVTSRPLDQLEDGQKTFLKYLNFILPILLILFYGLIRGQRKKALRYRRMQDNFI